VEVVVESATSHSGSSVSFEVPENEAPESLVHLWKEAAER